MRVQNYATNSSPNLSAASLYDQLLVYIERELDTSVEKVVKFEDWVKDIILDGKAFTYSRHEYLIDPYKDTHPHQVELKATQLGLTSKAMLRVVYGARYGSYRGILYLFPSKSDVTDFSKSRVDPLIDENPDTIGAWVQETDAANIKRIWNSFLYLRGMKSRVGLKSIPVDFVIFDELDEAPQNAVDMAVERMAHSEHKEQLKLSNPTLPDYGIDKAFQETDQRYWLLKCHKCNTWTDLVGEFPVKANQEVPCLIRLNGKVIRACRKCHAELDPSVGQWVAKHPAVTDKRGYQYSQLWSHYVDPKDILHGYRTTDNLTDLYNLKIGVAWAEAEARLAKQEVLNLCSDYNNQASDPGPCSMGIDQGKDLHVVIGRRGGDRDKIVHIGIYKDWKEMDRLMRNFNVSRCVVDALPETRNARDFAERFKDKVYLSYYNRHQKNNYAWNDKEWVVQSNRTESLDASHRQILNARVMLPGQTEVIRLFAEQMANVAKKLVEEEISDDSGIKHKTGSKTYIYIKLGPDHFRHAFSYETMARQYGAKTIFGDFFDDGVG